jgi:hypothetical protein
LEIINIKILTAIVKLEKFAKFIPSSKYIDEGNVLKINNIDVIKLFLKLRSSKERTMQNTIKIILKKIPTIRQMNKNH